VLFSWDEEECEDSSRYKLSKYKLSNEASSHPHSANNNLSCLILTRSHLTTRWEPEHRRQLQNTTLTRIMSRLSFQIISTQQRNEQFTCQITKENHGHHRLQHLFSVGALPLRIMSPLTGRLHVSIGRVRSSDIEFMHWRRGFLGKSCRCIACLRWRFCESMLFTILFHAWYRTLA